MSVSGGRGGAKSRQSVKITSETAAIEKEAEMPEKVQTAVPVRRGRGRPRKEKPLAEGGVETASSADEAPVAEEKAGTSAPRAKSRRRDVKAAASVSSEKGVKEEPKDEDFEAMETEQATPSRAPSRRRIASKSARTSAVKKPKEEPIDEEFEKMEAEMAVSRGKSRRLAVKAAGSVSSEKTPKEEPTDEEFEAMETEQARPSRAPSRPRIASKSARTVSVEKNLKEEPIDEEFEKMEAEIAVPPRSESRRGRGRPKSEKPLAKVGVEAASSADEAPVAEEKAGTSVASRAQSRRRAVKAAASVSSEKVPKEEPIDEEFDEMEARQARPRAKTIRPKKPKEKQKDEEGGEKMEVDQARPNKRGRSVAKSTGSVSVEKQPKEEPMDEMGEGMETEQAVPARAQSQAAVPVRRGRGRPKKEKPQAEVGVEAASSADEALVAEEKAEAPVASLANRRRSVVKTAGSVSSEKAVKEEPKDEEFDEMEARQAKTPASVDSAEKQPKEEPMEEEPEEVKIEQVKHPRATSRRYTKKEPKEEPKDEEMEVDANPVLVFRPPTPPRSRPSGLLPLGHPDRPMRQTATSVAPVRNTNASKVTPPSRRGRSVAPIRLSARRSLPRNAKSAAQTPEEKKEPKKEIKDEDTGSSSSSSSSDDDDISDSENGYAIPFYTARGYGDDFVDPTPRRKRGRPRTRPPTPPGEQRPRSRTPRKQTPKKVVTQEERKMEVMLTQLMETGNDDESLKATNFTDFSKPRVLLKKWALIERLEPLLRDTPCNRYLVTDVDRSALIHDGELRIYPISEMNRVNFEGNFLDRMDKLQRSHLVLLPLEHNVFVNTAKTVKFCYIVTAARSGPRIDEILQFHKGAFSDRDACRIAIGMLEVVEQIIKAGYCLLDVDPYNFAMDDESGRVYLRNCRNVGLGYERHGFSGIFEGADKLRWRGSDKYAPLASLHAPDTPMGECECLEAFFYVILELLGRFQFASNRETMLETKERWATADENGLTAELPAPLVTFWLDIRRGQRYIFNRTDTLQNGYIMYREARERRRGAKKSSAYVDYSLIYRCLKNLGIINYVESQPYDFCVAEPRVPDIALAGHLNQLSLEQEELAADVKVLERAKVSRDLHDRQMERERIRNERFLNNFLDMTKAEKIELDREFNEMEGGM